MFRGRDSERHAPFADGVVGRTTACMKVLCTAKPRFPSTPGVSTGQVGTSTSTSTDVALEMGRTDGITCSAGKVLLALLSAADENGIAPGAGFVLGRAWPKTWSCMPAPGSGFPSNLGSERAHCMEAGEGVWTSKPGSVKGVGSAVPAEHDVEEFETGTTDGETMSSKLKGSGTHRDLLGAWVCEGRSVAACWCNVSARLIKLRGTAGTRGTTT
mmetsp:Transcript_112935/g.364575  ORF Transcript_112935/g.364575 Transcript_112935/m.364575 type:complete len:214 (-) Transcript_112935:925-1566(-)